jgi:hypothetical protein
MARPLSLAVPYFEQYWEGLSLPSDKEDKFFVTGVYSSVHDRNKKRSLTQYHGKLKHYLAVRYLGI